MSRTTTVGLLKLATDLSARERELVCTIARLRLMTHRQLAALMRPAAVVDSSISDASAARTARRVLARLTADGVLSRLERRVGGLRAGSAGYVYYLGPVGQRLVAFWNGEGFVRGRFRPEPGAHYVRHTLAVSELQVQATMAARAGELELLALDVEPVCWRRSLDGLGGSTTLKPDAFVRVGIGAYEDAAFLEVDLGTESRSVIARKLRAYVDYFVTGTEQATNGVFPRVVILTTTETRVAGLVDVVSGLPAEYWTLFVVGRLERGLSVITESLQADAYGELGEPV